MVSSSFYEWELKEIAVGQQTRTRDELLSGLRTSRATKSMILSMLRRFGKIGPKIVPILSNRLNMLKAMLFGVLLVATYLLNTYISFIKIG